MKSYKRVEGCSSKVRKMVLLALCLGATHTALAAGSPDIVVSQVYGGGGNAGSTFRNDFIELYNRGTSSVSVNGWSVQYASSTGTSWSRTNLSGTIAPGQYYLIQEAQGAGGTTALPTPNATGTIAMSATAGKVVLLNTATTIVAGTVCPTGATVVDNVGYGTGTNCFEGSAPAPTPSNTTADQRQGSGATDTDNNSADFAATAPAPRNSSTVTPPPPPPPPPAVNALIREIQGAGHVSPLAGQNVITTGIVTGVVGNGFYMQDPLADSNPNTSEGIFVFTSTAPTVTSGNAVSVRGAVSEFRPGGSGGLSNLTTTELLPVSVTVNSSGNALPLPVVIGQSGRRPPTKIIDNDATGDVENSGIFEPITDGIDFFESLEGMRVQVSNPVVVGPRNSFGEIVVVGDNGAIAGLRTPRGGIVIRDLDFNPERIFIDDDILATPPANVGDHFVAPVVGVLGYSFGNFKLQTTTALTVVPGSLAQEVTAAATQDELAVATFNVENLDPGDAQSQFDALAAIIVNNLRSPDLITLEEVQDNNGALSNGVVDASQTYSRLISAISAAGGASYQVRQIDPVNNQDGGEPGGNIRVAFLFRTDRGLSFVDRPGGTSTSATSVVSGTAGPQLSASPGRIDPTNSAFNNSRKPLVGEFTFRGQKLFAIANHFNSKGGDQPLFGHFQPPSRSSEVQRTQQAQIVHDFTNAIVSLDPNAKVVVAGDFNDFEFSPALTILQGSILNDLFLSLPQAERYSYVFEGNSQSLDHILVSNNLRNATPFTYDVVHVNAEFAAQISDHDPQVVRLNIAPVNTAS